ncbi:hypothetical protein Vqi01_45720 [Micromonospora qiuiae]|uniref:TIGR02611 family protein n=1 Tax=Micromonospora qiuiae TaxID=502268 RepID=A0ABQ4JG25_9ACTN|nr:hypothetical protein Vqi01_45720 [Micromonospora qiuiae]
MPEEQGDRRGRSVVERGPSGDDRPGGNGSGYARENGSAGRGEYASARRTGPVGVNGGGLIEMNGSAEREEGAVAVSERRDHTRWRRRISTTLALIRANPTGRVALKIVVGMLGALVICVGVVLIPLPGPGWLIVIAGLGIWAVEFHWAKRLLNFTRRHVYGWAAWVKKQSLAVRFVIGSVGIVFVSAVALFSIKHSLGIDVIARVLHYLATH